MKNLFKNSFFSFFKNKIAIVLLIFIVFITSATFTMFSSAISAFSNSYNQVMREGNRHEYTIKELYNIDGEIVFEDPKPVQGANANFQIEEYDTPIVNSPSYLSFENEDYLVFEIEFKDTQYATWANIPTSKGLVMIKKQDAIDQNLNIIFPSSNVANTVVFASTKNDIKKADGTRQHMVTISLDETNINDRLEIQNIFGVMKSLTTIATPLEQIKAKIAVALDQSFNKKLTDYQRFEFGLDYASPLLGLIYKSLDKINNYRYTIGIKTTDVNLGWDILRNTKIIIENFYKSSGTLTEFVDYKKNEIYETAKFNLHKNLLEKLESYPEVIYKDVKSIRVASNSNTYKFVSEQSSEVNKIKIFEGYKLPEIESKEELTKKLIQKVQDLIDSVVVTNNDFASIALKNMYTSLLQVAKNPDEKFYTNWSMFVTTSFKTVRVIDYSSFAAIISPSYAKNNNISPIDIDTYNSIIHNPEFLEAIEDENTSFNQIKNVIDKLVPDKYKSSIIYAGLSPYFVIGTGITPDFAFPIISPESPIPNTHSQAIIYTNEAGYARIQETNQSASNENYIAIGFRENTPELRKTEIANELSHYTSSTNSWPTNINALERYDSENETVILAPKRVTFLDNLNKSISTVSYTVTGLLTIFTAFIVSLVIKKQIDNRKKQLGILLANGYSKLEIASSMMVIGIIIALIPTIIGYITGHWMQLVIMHIFNDYWTIPIYKARFDFVSLILTVILPLAGISLLAFIVSLIALKGRIPDILIGDTSKNNSVIKQLMKPMKLNGIKMKMGASLMFANIGKLIIAFMAFAASIVAMSISINSIDKFQIASQKSLGATNYEYQVDLITPTQEAGLYSAQNIDSIFYNPQTKNQINDISTEGILDAMLYPGSNPFNKANQVDHYDDAIILHVPNANDGNLAAPTFLGSKDYYPYYLKNRVQIKSLLNFDISAGINPWQIASKMMPENQKNTADLAEAEFINYVAQRYAKETGLDYIKYWQKLIDQNKGALVLDKNVYRLTENLKRLSYSPSSTDPEYGILTNPDRGQDQNRDLYLTQEYRHFIAYGLALVTNEYLLGNKDTKLPYFMSYNNLIVDKDDELYTYIDIDFSVENIQKTTKTIPLKIRGLNDNSLKSNTSMISISPQSLNALENYQSQNNEIVPVVINKFMQEYYQLSIGKTFETKINNMSDRYINDTKPNQKFEVVGIEDTYNDGKIYTLQSIANEVLGLNKLIKNNQLAKVPFNGVMTKEKSPLVFKSLSLYSPSSIYPGKNNIKLANKSEDGYVTINNSFFEPNAKYQFPNPNVTSMSELMKLYGNESSIAPMQIVYSSVDWALVSNYQFDSIMKLSSTLMNIVQIIILFIALSFVLLISTMIITDNKKFIATLKVMGYRGREISRIFLSTFIPTLIFAIAFATPISLLLVDAIRISIMGFGHILIPLYISGWEIALASVILLIGFLGMYALSLKDMRNTSLLQAFSD